MYRYDRVRLAPDRQIGAHSQSDFELTYVVTGSSVRILGVDHAPFSSGEVVLVPPGLVHEWKFSDTEVDDSGCIENICFHFSRSLIEKLSEIFPEIASMAPSILNLSEAVMFEGQSRESVLSALKTLDGRSASRRAGAVSDLVLAILDGLSGAARIGSLSPCSGDERRLDKIRVYISCNYSRELRLGDIARYLGMNRTSFCRFFKKHYGVTFVSYLNEVRIERACEALLSQDSRSVAEIAADCGFNSAAHFCRVFRNVKGCSPSSLRIEKDTP